MNQAVAYEIIHYWPGVVSTGGAFVAHILTILDTLIVHMKCHSYNKVRLWHFRLYSLGAIWCDNYFEKHKNDRDTQKVLWYLIKYLCFSNFLGSIPVDTLKVKT